MTGSDAPHVEGLIAALVQARAGLHYGPQERELFRQRLDDHVADRGFDSLLDYYYHLRYDAEGTVELDRLVEALLVHETYFFRELSALRSAVDNVVIPAIERRGRARVWSAACSTGEEPLSIAMLLAERGLLDRCEIIASDISELALARVRSGRYRTRSLRDEGVALAQRWLRCEPDEITTPPFLRAALDIRCVNLCNPEELALLGTFDLVLCRHVLIYFDDARVSSVIAALAEKLRYDGALLVGVSESLMRFSNAVHCEELGGTFIYRRST
ncbi:MAG TPA: CheR family methyltransferase [Nannocystaceae bacterium]|nr:CheR family methyltransferase [Nannocystaceae bacterium]